MPLCRDGCGQEVTGGREFVAGHATIYADQLRDRVFRQRDRAAFDELYRRGWKLKDIDERLAFGVEAEFFGIQRNEALSVLRREGFVAEDDGYHHQVRDFWRITHDGSVNAEGNELVSPILKMGKAHMKDLHKVTRTLRQHGGAVDRSCGLHVHHAAALLDIPDIAEMVGHWAVFQPTINTIIPKSRTGAQYSLPIFDARHWMNAVMRFDSINGLRRASGEERFGRYHAINLCAISKHNTIEFRQHSGTLNGQKIEMWTRFTKLFTQLYKQGKRCDELLLAHDNDEQVVATSMGLQGMLSYLEAPASMIDYYILRQEALIKDEDREDADSNQRYDRQVGNGTTDSSRSRRWCSFHQEWHPYADWADHNRR